MKTNEQKLFSKPATLEITTIMGCRVNCKYCPQELLLHQYYASSKIQKMSIDTFEKCIDKLPADVQIDFSGMSEPWLNPECTDMLLYAAEKNHPIAVYTTLVGMTKSDFERIKHIDFTTFALHLPDEFGNSTIPVDQEYLELFEYVFKYFYEKKVNIETSCHGLLHPQIARVLSNEFPNYPLRDFEKSLIDRAGNLDELDLAHQKKIGAIECKLSGSNFNHNILLPDGSVLLCCMDYGMEIVLGNLLEMDYMDLFKSETFYSLQESTKNGAEIICRRCNNAVRWEAPYEILDFQSIKNDEKTTIVEKLCAFLCEKSESKSVVRFKPDKPISFVLHDIRDTVPLITNMDRLFEHNTIPSWGAIHQMLNHVPFVVMFMPVPESQHSQRSEWQRKTKDVTTRLSSLGFKVDQIGTTPQNSDSPGIVCILKKPQDDEQNVTPADFRVTAIISSYNEEDVIIPIIDHLHKEGVDVYLIDNWSSDRTYERASSMMGKGLVGIEKYPRDIPARTYDWVDILNRKVELTEELEADWFIHYDADEIRESPWQGVNLRDAIYRVEREGYNAIDFTIIDFPPTDNTYQDGTSLKDHFHYCEFGKRPGHFVKISAWQKTAEKPDLSSSGGHEIKFNGRKVYPFKFLMRHYPIRSQAQGEKKVFEDRQSRWNAQEKKKGWHNQYDNFKSGQKFVKDPKDLIPFNDDFYYRYLIERLTGLGVKATEMKKVELADKMDESGNYTDPNRYARSFSMEEMEDHIVFHGYQEFKLFGDHLEIFKVDENLQRKSNALKRFLNTHNLSDRSVFDLGANSGYFCYYALQHGAKKSIALEMDAEYVAALEAARKKFALDQLQIITENFENVTTKGDIVIALAFIHWIYSCTSQFGSLESIVKRLAALTDYALIIEWIAPDDPAIQFFDHLSWNQEAIEEEYSYDMFEKALTKYFKRVNMAGVISPTRRIYIAYKTENDIYTGTPIPIKNNKELISSRILTIHEGVEYWSDVYDDGKYIYKRSVSDLAFRESLFLKELNSPSFPKVIDAKMFDEYSEIQIEKINGIRLDENHAALTSDRDRFYTFVSGCLEILKQLQDKGITHRDIRQENMFVRDGLPVLFDFGWALSETNQIFAPRELGSNYRPPDGQFSDVYSMGLVLSDLNDQRFPELTSLTKLMTIPDRQYRNTDISILRDIFNYLQSSEAERDQTNYQIPIGLYLKLNDYANDREIKTQNLLEQLAEKENSVLTLNFQLQEQKQIALDYKTLLEEQKQISANLQHQILGFTQHIENLSVDLEYTRCELEQTKEEAASYTLSTSWLLTRPFRKITGWIRRKIKP